MLEQQLGIMEIVLFPSRGKSWAMQSAQSCTLPHASYDFCQGVGEAGLLPVSCQAPSPREGGWAGWECINL